MSEQQDLFDFIKYVRDGNHFDLVYIWCKMVHDNAFYHSALGIVMGFELAMSGENRKLVPDNEPLFRAKTADSNVFQSESVQEALLQLERNHNKYQLLKRGLANQ